MLLLVQEPNESRPLGKVLQFMREAKTAISRRSKKLDLPQSVQLSDPRQGFPAQLAPKTSVDKMS
jgi:hypothetical protein